MECKWTENGVWMESKWKAKRGEGTTREWIQKGYRMESEWIPNRE